MGAHGLVLALFVLLQACFCSARLPPPMNGKVMVRRWKSAPAAPGASFRTPPSNPGQGNPRHAQVHTPWTQNFLAGLPDAVQMDIYQPRSMRPKSQPLHQWHLSPLFDDPPKSPGTNAFNTTQYPTFQDVYLPPARRIPPMTSPNYRGIQSYQPRRRPSFLPPPPDRTTTAAPIFRMPPMPTTPPTMPFRRPVTRLPVFRPPPKPTSTVPPMLRPLIPQSTPPPRVIIVTQPPQFLLPQPLLTSSCSCKKGFSMCPHGEKKVGDCEEEGQEGSWCCGYEMALR